MSPILILFGSMLISMLVIPLMRRVAPRLGMIDLPNERKVHRRPIARVGGFGIVLGAAIPLLLWLPTHSSLIWYLMGAMVLLIFGAVDDRFNIGHYYKFAGQLIAVVPLVCFGDVYVDRLPMFDDVQLSPWIGKPITVFAMVGMVNAMNHSDGLDGLAGGEALLSLLAMCFLAYSVVGVVEPGAAPALQGAILAGLVAVVVAAASIGGVLGFLRYNTHPAHVFMGDTGSQFLGYTVGFIAVFLVTQVDRNLSVAAPLLLLGLPVLDILAVVVLRWKHGMHVFKASRNHVHHRLLDLGFAHYESVVIIYSIQALFVICGLLLAYGDDWQNLALYGALTAALFCGTTLAERRGWRCRRRGEPSKLDGWIGSARGRRALAKGPLWFLAISIPLYLVASAIWVGSVSRDFGVMSVLLVAAFAVELVFVKSRGSIIARIVVYATAIFVVYLGLKNGLGLTEQLKLCDQLFFVLLGIAIALALRYAASPEFSLTPMDYLIAFIVLAAGFVSFAYSPYEELGLLAVKVIIIVYGCEILLSESGRRWSSVSLASLAALSIVGVKGLWLV